MITFELLKDYSVVWTDRTTSENLSLFQTPAWLDFVTATQRARPVIAEIHNDNRLLGHFFGLVSYKLGFRILGSPFRGWNTDFMGFSYQTDVSKNEILRALPKFVFKTLGCHYFELIDPSIRISDCEGVAFDVEYLPRYVLDLTRTEDEIFASMKSSCRNLIRQSIRNGVSIEIASDPEFSEDYYAQLKQVFAKQSLNPPYSLERLKTLINHMLPTGNLLLLRAKDPTGTCIATGILLALNKSAVYWGAASWREFQHLRPNELMAWYGMKYWKERGIKEFHFGGGWEQYKSKYGCEEIQVLRLMKSKYSALDYFRKILMTSQSQRLRNWAIRRF